jgi:hypothetical protein
VFVVRVWGGQYREELILNITVFVVRVWGGQYREELILNITVFVVGVGWGVIYRGTETEYCCVCCDCLGREILRRTET